MPTSANIQHEFLAIDEGLGTLLHVDECDPSHDWIIPIDKPQPRDMQLVGNNRVLISHDGGYLEFDIATGERVRDVSFFEGVTSARRQPDGHTLLAGVNLCETVGIVVVELSQCHEVLRKTVFLGDYVRLIRQTSKGTFLMMCDTRIREGTAGDYIWDAPVEGLSHTWKAVRLPSGNTLAAAGYGASLVELDPAGKVVRRFGGRENVPVEVNPFFYAMFQLLPDGSIVVANWQGHGPGHGCSGIQLLQFDANGSIVWSWSKPDRISSLQGVLVLDGLDTALLHDERNGPMEPI